VLVKGPHQVEVPFVIQPAERRVVPAPFAGHLAEARVEPGDTVAAGDVLAVLDTADLLAERQELAEQRQALLVEVRKAETPSERDAARHRAAALAHQIGRLQRQAARATITAPIVGVVVEGGGGGAGARGRDLQRLPQDGEVVRVKSFGKWLVERERLGRNSAAALRSRTPEYREHRRALRPDGAARLVAAAEAGKTMMSRTRGGRRVLRWRLTGPQRALLYRFALETAMRRSALERLTVADLDLDLDLDLEAPTVTVRPKANTKSRRPLTIPLRAETAAAAAAAGRRPRTARAGHAPGRAARRRHLRQQPRRPAPDTDRVGRADAVAGAVPVAAGELRERLQDRRHRRADVRGVDGPRPAGQPRALRRADAGGVRRCDRVRPQIRPQSLRGLAARLP